MIWLGIGAGLAVATFIVINRMALSRQLVVYHWLILVIFFIYPMFALLTGDVAGLVWHSFIAVVLTGVALLPHQTGLLQPAALLIMHGNLDLAFHRIEILHVSPDWYGAACGAFDIVLGGLLLVSYLRRKPD